MKKIFLLVAGIAVMASCTQNGNQNNTAEKETDSLQTVINQKDNELNDLMGTFNEIQEGFNRINEAQGRVNMLSENAENNSTVQNIQENMQFIEETMAENQKLIEELQKKLKNSSINAAKFKDAVNSLTAQLNEKNKEIEDLRAQLSAKDIQIAQLGDSVTNLTSENTKIKEESDMNARIAKTQDEQLNTAWYVFGTNSELKERRILVGGKALTTNDFDKDYFTKIDIRKTTVIPLGSKSAKLMTTHPSGTYSLLKDAKGEYTLRITNPTKFWSISKYLVIKVR